MVKKIFESDEEFEVFAKERNRLENLISNKSLLIGVLNEDCKCCPYCDNDIDGKEGLREKLLQMMREYNDFIGRKCYVSHIEGNNEWKV